MTNIIVQYDSDGRVRNEPRNTDVHQTLTSIILEKFQIMNAYIKDRQSGMTGSRGEVVIIDTKEGVVESSDLVKGELSREGRALEPMGVVIGASPKGRESEPAGTADTRKKSVGTEMMVVASSDSTKRVVSPVGRALEPLCRATSRWPAVSNYGDLLIQVEENKKCRRSLNTGYHVVRSEGTLRIYFTVAGMPVQDDMIMRGVLVRKNKLYRGLCVERVCEKHEAEMDQDNISQVLQGGNEHLGNWQFGKTGPRRSVEFKVGTTCMLGKLQGNISLRIMCNDACITSNRTEQQPEASREMLIILTVESRKHDVILARRSIDVWSKSRIVTRDLAKPSRLLSKGPDMKRYRPQTQALAQQARPNNVMNKRIQQVIKEAKRVGISLFELCFLVTSEYEGVVEREALEIQQEVL